MSSTHERLTIKYETTTEFVIDSDPPIEVLFNPSELSYSKRINWETQRTAISNDKAEDQKLKFTSSELETLTVSLFFDTYGAGVAGSLGDMLGPLAEPLGVGTSAPEIENVLIYTSKVVQLSRFSVELHRPPICELYWGQTFIFRGVLQSISQKLLMFLEDGTPVRATLDCEFKQFQTQDDRLNAELHSADVTKRYTVLPGDTLTGIAAALYGDPALWRPIAKANRIDDPRRISPGRVLTIPKLR